MLVRYMNRTDLQILAEDRLKDAEVLLANGRFGAAYYLAGYAVECGLKACVFETPTRASRTIGRL
jgi:HEPN domain-containing protein